MDDTTPQTADENIDKIDLKDTSEETLDAPEAKSAEEVAQEAMAEVGVNSDGNDELATLQSIEAQIKVNIAKIGRLKEEMKPQKEMLRDFLNNDEAFIKLTEAASKASKDKGARKKQLLQEPHAAAINDKLTMMKEEMKEADEALSDYLRAYQEKTGLNEFEGEDGELRQIVYKAKLVRKTNLNR